ncbi:MAG TPA: hypothetical protein VFI06_12060 [Chitinophagaceae bacterium]|nr:hypothetical protein [Chitinophagaceae bacterium]
MKKALLKNLLLIFLLSFELTGCYKRNFYEDPDDPGLSRFTNRSYNVTSAYINSEPWVSVFSGSLSGAYHTSIFWDSTSASRDTLHITWRGEFSDQSLSFLSPWSDWRFLSFSMPVKKNFSKEDFLGFNGKIFPADSTTVTVTLSPYEFISPAPSVSGTGKIYFVKVNAGPHDREFTISGLFEGTLGSVLITKGRFDYRITPADHNLR